MSTVTFYILQSDQLKRYYAVVIQLIIKAYESGNHVLIYSKNDELLHTLNELLWSISPESFIPHRLILSSDEKIDPLDKIIFANNENINFPKDVLFQLNEQPFDGYDAYNRTIEIMYQEPHHLECGRSRFKFYRQKGDNPQVINL